MVSSVQTSDTTETGVHGVQRHHGYTKCVSEILGGQKWGS